MRTSNPARKAAWLHMPSLPRRWPQAGNGQKGQNGRKGRFAVRGLSLVALVAALPPAYADATFTVAVEPTQGNNVFPCPTGQVTNLSGSSPLSMAYDCGPNNGSISGGAIASPGNAGVFAASNGGGSMFALAQFSDDLVFSPRPGNTTAGDFRARLNLVFTGDILVPGVLPDSFSDARYSIAVTIGPNTFTRSLQMFNGRLSVETVNGLDLSPGGQTLVDGVSDHIAALVTTPVITLPVNLPVHLVAAIQVVAEGAGGKADFLHSFDFPIGQDVFTFEQPDAYTVNAPSSHIVDNRYLGPVPEPATWLTLAAGLGSLLLRRSVRPRT